MQIAERHNCVVSGDTVTRTSKTKFLRYVGAVLLCFAVVLACSANATAQQTIWPSAAVPATVDNGPDSPVELGVSFKADNSGTITGIRFYKSAANTGVHVGHLWSHTGALLATVTFTGETASGWQQANFSTPVAITANIVYLASYQAAVGHWSVNWNYFATSGANNPPLHALQNGSGTPDGVWGLPGTFPTHTNSSNYWIDVVFKSGAGVAPSIKAQPASQTVTAGQTATFSVTATGTAPLTYQWKKNNVAISGASLSSYTAPATTSSDNGAQFTVTISNAAGTIASNAATLTVNVPPSITAQPVSRTVTAGQPATFSITATGTAPLMYQWKKNGANLTGATSSVYTTPATSASDNGTQFTVAINNAAGNATSNVAVLTVNVPPSITAQPASQTVTVGQTATFLVTASGTAPLSYQWQRNGATITGATSASYTTPVTCTLDKGAQFTVVVSNSAGSVTSNAATLTVNGSTVVAPSITTQPNSLTVTSGQTATFSANASGTAQLGYQWQKNGTPIGGATLASYTTPATTTTDSGAQFSVVVSNSAGSVTSNNATLTVNPAIQSTFTAWVTSSLLRVGQTDTPGTTSFISLSSARGETVDAQVIVQGPAGGLTNVNLSASALIGPGGVTVPASNVTLYREHYLTVNGTANYGGGSNPPLGSGTYAEPLIPFNDPETGSSLCGTSATLKACNAAVTAGQNQPYWIDISVPRGSMNSPPGTYTGNISITADQGTVTIPVSLMVWNFELPAQPSELSLWTLWPPAAGNTTSTLAQALMRNKVMGWYDAAANASSDITSLGLNRSGLDGYYYIGIQCNGSYSSIPSTSQINAAAANFPAGLGLDFYLADELNGCTGDYSAIRTMGTNAHAANRSVKTMMTLNGTDPNLYGAIDHWVLLDSLQQWPAIPFTAGGDLWSYTSCNAGYGNTPEWMVDYPPINERIQAGFLNWTQGATGLLYYRADGWTAGNAIGSWNNVDTTACGGGLGRPGDGIFLYPPGPIASTESAPGIRLKAIRDGIQDYEYAQILKNLGQVPFLNSVIQPIATSWSTWSHDPNALESARLQLGQQLHQLSPP